MGLLRVLPALLLSSSVGASPIFSDGFEGEAPPSCTNQPSSIIEWQRAWSSRDGRIQAQYPNSVGFPVPIGADKNFPTAIGWTPGENETVNIYFDTAQADPVHGYRMPRPAMSMTLAFSQCAGSFETTKSECIVSANSASLFWTTVPNLVGACYLEPGKRYYLNIKVDQCADVPNSALGCDVQAIHRQQ